MTILLRNEWNNIPQTGLALMGFSLYCPSSLDPTNFVVQCCRGAVRRLSLADSLESGNLELWESGNLESQQIKKVRYLRMDIRSAQNVYRVP